MQSPLHMLLSIPYELVYYIIKILKPGLTLQLLCTLLQFVLGITPLSFKLHVGSALPTRESLSHYILPKTETSQNTQSCFFPLMIIQFQPHLHSVTPLLRDSKHMGSLAVHQVTLMYFCSPHYNPKDIRLPGFKTVCFYHSSPATHIPQKPLERRCSKPVHREKQL